MHETRNLAVCAVATAAAYALLPAQFPLVALVGVPQLDLGSATGRGAGAAAAFVIGALAVYLAYAKAYTLARQIEERGAPSRPRALWIVLGGAALFAGILVWTYPVGAVDVYDYAFRVRMWAYHGLNPLIVAPEAASSDLWLPYVAWTTYPSPYGAWWMILSSATYGLAGGTLLGSVLLLKVLELASLLGATAIIYAMLRGTGRAMSGALLLAWNPLVLFELAVNGHNDGMLMLLVAGALYFFEQRQQRVAAWIFLALAAQVKVIAVVFVPVLVCSTLIRERGAPGSLGRSLRSIAMGLLAFGATWALVYAPWWAGMQTLDAIWLLQERYTSSFAAVLKLAVEAALPTADGSSVAGPLFAALGVAGVAIVLWRGWRSSHAAPYMALAVLWPLLCLSTLWFQPWYAVWLVVLAPLGGASQRRVAVLVSVGALALYVLYDYAWFWQPALLNAGNTLAINIAAVGLWLVLPLTASWLYARRRRPDLPRFGS